MTERTNRAIAEARALAEKLEPFDANIVKRLCRSAASMKGNAKRTSKEFIEEREKRKLLLDTLQHIERWFDTDAEVLETMDFDTRADHCKQHNLIKLAISVGSE